MKRTIQLLACLMICAGLLCSCAWELKPEIPSPSAVPSEPPETPTPQPTPSAPPSTPLPTETPTVITAGYTTAQANVYTEPSPDSEVYLTLNAHTDLDLVTQENGFWEILIEDTEYYIDSSCVREKAQSNGMLVVIDAGHQGKGNNEKEPIGPGATEQK